MTQIALISCAFLFFGLTQPGFGHGDLHEVIEGVSAKIVEAPADASLRLRRAELHRLHQDWAAAEADYQTALQLQPDLDVVEFGLAELRHAQGREDESLIYLNHFLGKCPRHAEGYLLRSKILESRGDWKLAKKDLAAAVNASSEPHYASCLSELLIRHDQVDDAIRCLDEASRVHSGIPVLEQRALDIEERYGRVDAALKRLDGFIALQPRPDIWLVRKGRLLQSAGRTAEAGEAWRMATVAFDLVPEEKRGLDINRKIKGEIDAGLASTAK